jgi:hypothetical protein
VPQQEHQEFEVSAGSVQLQCPDRNSANTFRQIKEKEPKMPANSRGKATANSRGNVSFAEDGLPVDPWDDQHENVSHTVTDI